MTVEAPAPWPNFSSQEADAVRQVLLSNRVNYWTGQECREFEREFAEFAGTKRAIALANGTVALDLALHGLSIGAHNGGSSLDEVIVTPRSFIASVSCVVNAGARPVFADVDLDSGNISATTIKPALTDNTRAILCVHLAGLPCDMDAIRSVADKGIHLIEDCAQAHGTLYKGRPVGGLGDVAAWSFCQDKIMTTGGEGGMITCNDEALWRKMWAFKDHGKSFEAVYERDHAPGFRWLHESIGTNWRMIEMQAAIGRIQLTKMADWNRQRSENAERLRQLLRPYSGPNGYLRVPNLKCADCACLPEAVDYCRNGWYRFIAYVRPEHLPIGETRDTIIEHLQSQGISCMQGSCSEIYLEKAFDNSGLRPLERLPIARELGETSITFLVHPGLKILDFHLPKLS